MREAVSECTFAVGQCQNVRCAQTHTHVPGFAWLWRNTAEERAPQLKCEWLRSTFLSAALLYSCLCFFPAPALDLWAIVSFSDCFWKGFMAARAHSIQQITHFTTFIYFISWVFFIFCTSLTLHYSNLKGFAYQSQEKSILFVVGLKCGFHQFWSSFLFIYFFLSTQHEK